MLENSQTETGVTSIVGVQTVIVRGALLRLRRSEIDAVVSLHRVETRILIEIDARDSPILAGLTQDVHVLLDIEALLVSEILVGLDIQLVTRRIAEVGIGAMDGGHDDDLRGGIIVLEPRQTHVDTAAEGGIVHTPLTMTGRDNPAIAIADGIALGEELAHGDAMVVVVGTSPDEDGIDGSRIGLLHELGLLENLVPLMSAAGIDTRLYAERVAEQIVIVIICCGVIGVGHRIAQKGTTLALPRTGYGRRDKDKEEEKGQ